MSPFNNRLVSLVTMSIMFLCDDECLANPGCVSVICTGNGAFKVVLTLYQIIPKQQMTQIIGK